MLTRKIGDINKLNFYDIFPEDENDLFESQKTVSILNLTKNLDAMHCMTKALINWLH